MLTVKNDIKIVILTAKEEKNRMIAQLTKQTSDGIIIEVNYTYFLDSKISEKRTVCERKSTALIHASEIYTRTAFLYSGVCFYERRHVGGGGVFGR